MSDRLSARFAATRAGGRAALVTFVTAGDPTPDLSPRILHALVAGGADVIEVGMPFTDPMADGPAIQAGNLRALGAGMTLRRLLAMVREFRSIDDATPLVLMGYANPILAYGGAAFARDAAAAGLDGVIVVDLPPEEDGELLPDLRAHGLHMVRLATPTTDAARLPAVVAGASGFLYYVAVAGVTGANSADVGDIADAMARIRTATDLPIAVGFGIRTPADAAAMARHADGVVVGSAIVNLIGAGAAARANDIPEQVTAFVRSLADAVHGARQEEAA
ncbi:tryptophan synthase subunit alpha [Sandaracinobacteroides saxicola]|uniref:Tryptophan synthase alpha chain n=1 Tax=Sandaracinobacteroides saxicola TaxID=2759707 RepID=A0A7G5IH31_9SPHN|nr:tryptophan synthase subunit alpha [Sandaracinobacteroides saxicola]QMW22673.1 tryptophan synthase subunit alpha [Sandaracinobacteroides saxicola]